MKTSSFLGTALFGIEMELEEDYARALLVAGRMLLFSRYLYTVTTVSFDPCLVSKSASKSHLLIDLPEC